MFSGCVRCDTCRAHCDHFAAVGSYPRVDVSVIMGERDATSTFHLCQDVKVSGPLPYPLPATLEMCLSEAMASLGHRISEGSESSVSHQLQLLSWHRNTD
jgi:hypothetical protein